MDRPSALQGKELRVDRGQRGGILGHHLLLLIFSSSSSSSSSLFFLATLVLEQRGETMSVPTNLHWKQTTANIETNNNQY